MVEVTRAPDYPDHSLPLFLRITAQPPGYNACADKSYGNDDRKKRKRSVNIRNHCDIYIDGEKIDGGYEAASEVLGVARATVSWYISNGNGRAVIRGHDVLNKSFSRLKVPRVKRAPTQKQSTR